MDGFNVKQCLYTYLPNLDKLSLLELCSYLGSVNCFKFLRTKFNSDITHHCLGLSFIGGNPDIISECFKNLKPDYRCIPYSIMSHNIDFVTYLIDFHYYRIRVRDCEYFNNLQAFFVHLDRTNDFKECLIYSPIFNIPSLCEYFLSNREHINDEEFHFLPYRKINYDIMTKLLFYFLECHHFSNAASDEKITEFLIANGAYVKAHYSDGKTPLHLAANKSVIIAEVLISHGADINAKDIFGYTPLHIAVQSKYFSSMVKFLTEQGADVNAIDNDMKTPLHYVVEEYDPSIDYVKILISSGANVNAMDINGNTPLQYAIKKIIKKL